MRSALVSVIFEPFGRLNRFVPELAAARERLVDMGLMELKPAAQRRYRGQEPMMLTQKGWVAHLMAREINPMRASYRTPVALERAVIHRIPFRDEFKPQVPDPERRARVMELLAELEGLGVAERDPKFEKYVDAGGCWRICVD